MPSGTTRANSAPLASGIGLSHLVRLLADWAHQEGVLHVQLESQLRRLVHSGRLPAGVRLPSERALAAGISVSRNTVGAAFDELRGDGLLVSRPGAGTYVSSARRYLGARGDDRLNSFISVPEVSTDGWIDLRSAALPGLSLVAEEVARTRVEDIRHLVLTHGYLPAGLPELKEALADHYGRLGLPTAGEQILITSGAQQALRLVAASFVEPGATVLVEEPSFRGAIEVLRAAGAHLVPVASGPEGVDVDALRRAAERLRPTLVVVQSTVHNPTGSVMDDQRRRAVASLSTSLGVPVLDDTAPADTLIDGSQPSPLAAFGGSVITVGSVSKSFWGGLRVGWLRADSAIVQSLASIKSSEDLGTSLVDQMVTLHLLPRIESARGQRRESLRARRQELLDTFKVLLPEWEPQVPAGGASLWIRLPRPCATSFAQRVERAGVQVLPGPTFSCVDGLDNYLRIAYAAPIDYVSVGIQRMASVWAEFP